MNAEGWQVGLFEPKAGRQEFTGRDALRLLFKHKWLILFCFVAVGSLVAAGVASLPPTYISTAKVWVQIEAGGSPSFFSGIAAYRDPLQQDPANRTMENEMELAETWPIAAKVVQQTGLTYDQVYKAPLTHLMQPAMQLYDAVAEGLLGLPADPDKHGYANTVALFLKSLEVRPVISKSADSNSNIISLALRGTDPERARQGLEAVIANYVAYENTINRASAEKAYAVVAAKLRDAQADVDAAQARLETFLADPSGRDLTSPRDSTTLAALKSHLLDLQVQLANRQSLFQGHSAQNAALEGSIAILTAQLEREQRHSARDEAGLTGRERDLRVKEGVLVDLERRLSQIGIYLDMNDHQVTNRVVVEPPLKAAGSEWKQRAMIAVAGAVGGLLLGLGLAGVREMLEQRLESEGAVRQYLGLPVIAVLPVVRRAQLRALLAGSALP